jgi:hypothetical protein
MAWPTWHPGGAAAWHVLPDIRMVLKHGMTYLTSGRCCSMACPTWHPDGAAACPSGWPRRLGRWGTCSPPPRCRTTWNIFFSSVSNRICRESTLIQPGSRVMFDHWNLHCFNLCAMPLKKVKFKVKNQEAKYSYKTIRGSSPDNSLSIHTLNSLTQSHETLPLRMSELRGGWGLDRNKYLDVVDVGEVGGSCQRPLRIVPVSTGHVNRFFIDTQTIYNYYNTSHIPAAKFCCCEWALFITFSSNYKWFS